ncbi:major facilitator transporter, putative [Babesia ovata]|uniref:Major facilitator transporter, putative n=1 Tax=Babesia ovata TaxID=189622 RepID=A0A2H6KJ48_9APIC|nr:major facilitator transporter, putative [Babesia ovata]GBE63006.1 major facilitator transporter, putative [Babesia ovata]
MVVPGECLERVGEIAVLVTAVELCPQREQLVDGLTVQVRLVTLMVRVRTPGRFVVPHSQQMTEQREHVADESKVPEAERGEALLAGLIAGAVDAFDGIVNYTELMRQEAGTAVGEEGLERRGGRAVVSCVIGLLVESVTLPVGGRHLPTVVALPPALGCGGGTAALGVEEIQHGAQTADYLSQHIKQLVGVGRVVQLCGVVGEVDGVGAVVPVVAGELAYLIASPVVAAFLCQVAKRLVRHRDDAQQHLGVLVGVSLPALRSRVARDVRTAELPDEGTESPAHGVQRGSGGLLERLRSQLCERVGEVVEQASQPVVEALRHAEELVAHGDGLLEVTGAEGVDVTLDFFECFVDVIFFEKPQLPIHTTGFARNLGAQFTKEFVDVRDCIPVEIFNVFLDFFKTFIFVLTNLLYHKFHILDHASFFWLTGILTLQLTPQLVKLRGDLGDALLYVLGLSSQLTLLSVKAIFNILQALSIVIIIPTCLVTHPFVLQITQLFNDVTVQRAPLLFECILDCLAGFPYGLWIGCKITGL